MDYRITEKEAFRIIGDRIEISSDLEENFPKVTAFWEKTTTSGILKELFPLLNGEPVGLLGATLVKDAGKDCYYYYIGVASDKPAPEGMFEDIVPKHTWAIFSDSGHPSGIGELYKRIFSEWLPASGYEWADMVDVEVYLDDNPVNMKYEVWLPITKKTQ